MVFVHPVLSANAAERLAALPVKEFITTDTVPIPPEKRAFFGDRLKILSVAAAAGRGDPAAPTKAAAWAKCSTSKAMPELPEVETIVRACTMAGAAASPFPAGRSDSANLLWERTLAEPSAAEFLRRLPGQTVQRLSRRGQIHPNSV